MVALDRGGQCRGVVYSIPSEQADDTLHRLFRRELVIKNSPNMVRWLKVQTPERILSALAFVANPQSRFYSGKLPLDNVAEGFVPGCWALGFLRRLLA